jgi:hypothetical protein
LSWQTIVVHHHGTKLEKEGKEKRGMFLTCAYTSVAFGAHQPSGGAEASARLYPGAGAADDRTRSPETAAEVYLLRGMYACPEPVLAQPRVFHICYHK